MRFILDTNTIIRFMTGEPENQAKAVATLIEQCDAGKLKLVFLPMVVAECVFVLTSFYKQERKDVCDALRYFIESPDIEVDEEDRLLEALAIFSRHKIDFVDCYLAAAGKELGIPVASFDKDFGRLDDVQWLNPLDYPGTKAPESKA